MSEAQEGAKGRGCTTAPPALYAMAHTVTLGTTVLITWSVFWHGRMYRYTVLTEIHRTLIIVIWQIRIRYNAYDSPSAITDSQPAVANGLRRGGSPVGRVLLTAMVRSARTSCAVRVLPGALPIVVALHTRCVCGTDRTQELVAWGVNGGWRVRGHSVITNL